jgi:hypothetical protein
MIVEKYHVRYLRVRKEWPEKAMAKRTAARMPRASEGR